MNKLLICYDNMGRSSERNCKQLCRKKEVLFMLLGARKKQVLLAIDIANVIVQTGKSILLPHKTLKHTNPKHPLQPIMYHSFSKNKNVFIVNCLKFYIGEGNKIMDENQGRQMITYESLIRRSLKTLSR